MQAARHGKNGAMMATYNLYESCCSSLLDLLSTSEPFPLIYNHTPKPRHRVVIPNRMSALVEQTKYTVKREKRAPDAKKGKGKSILCVSCQKHRQRQRHCRRLMNFQKTLAAHFV